jgi:hypothetical protein
VQRVGAGDHDVRVPVDDAGEIGLLQEGVNTMVAGLAERERLRDLFGLHVGTTVAQQAMVTGGSLGGELRTVAALVVDIAGSTSLVLRTGPEQMVGLLNRFFAVVVETVEGEGGLVNKFEGDAVLCVFGAPADHPDPAGAALRAARWIAAAVRPRASSTSVSAWPAVRCGSVRSAPPAGWGTRSSATRSTRPPGSPTWPRTCPGGWWPVRRPCATPGRGRSGSGRPASWPSSAAATGPRGPGCPRRLTPAVRSWSQAA